MNAKNLFDKAQDLRSQEKLDEAISVYQDARKQALKNNDNWLAAECLHSIGIICYQSEKYAAAKNPLNKAKEEFETLRDHDLVGAVLRDLGLVAFGQKDYKLALQFMDQSIDAYKDSERIGHLGISKVKRGKVLAALHKIDQAEEEIKAGVELIKKSPDRFFESIALYDLANIYKQAGQKDKARVAAQKSVEVLDQIASKDEHQSRRKKLAEFIQSLDQQS